MNFHVKITSQKNDLFHNNFEVDIDHFNENTDLNNFKQSSPDVIFSCGNIWNLNINCVGGNYEFFVVFHESWCLKAKFRMDFYCNGSIYAWNAVHSEERLSWISGMRNELAVVRQVKIGDTVRDLNNSFLSSVTKKLKIKIFIDIQPGQKRNKRTRNLAQNLTAYLRADRLKLSDVTLICGEGDKFPAHKLILSAQSEVFNVMFATHMTESATNEIVISDFDSTTVKSFVDYLYTEVVEESEDANLLEFYTNLLKIAHKYAVSSLVEYCEEFFMYHISKDNAVNMLLLSDMYALPSLKRAAIGVIGANFEEISAEIDVEKALPPNLLVDIIRYLAKK